MNTIKALLRSRKFVLTILTITTVLLKDYLKLSPEQIALIAGAITVLVLAIMGEDISKHIKINVPEKNSDQLAKLITNVSESFAKSLEEKSKSEEKKEDKSQEEKLKIL